MESGMVYLQYASCLGNSNHTGAGRALLSYLDAIPLSKCARNCTLPGSFCINFNYTSAFEYVFDVPRTRVCHIHGTARDRQSMVYGHALHPWEPDGFMEELGGRFEGLYRILKALYRTDKHTQENIRLLRYALAFQGARAQDVQDVFVIGFSMSEPDMDYLRFLAQSGYPAREYEDDMAAREPIDTLDALMARMDYEIQRFGCGIPDDEIPPEKKRAMEHYYLAGLRGAEMGFRKTVKRSLRRRKGASSLDKFCQIPPKTSGVTWHITCHSRKDRDRAREVMADLGVKDYELLDTVDEAVAKLVVDFDMG